MGQQSKQKAREHFAKAHSAHHRSRQAPRERSKMVPRCPRAPCRHFSSSSRTLHESLAARAANVSPPLCECPVIASYFAASAAQTPRKPSSSAPRALSDRPQPAARDRLSSAVRTCREPHASASGMQTPREHCTNSWRTQRKQSLCERRANTARTPRKSSASTPPTSHECPARALRASTDSPASAVNAPCAPRGLVANATQAQALAIAARTLHECLANLPRARRQRLTSAQRGPRERPASAPR